MTRLLERERALKLRKEGKSYNEIKGILGVSKSTLSVWLRQYPLTKERIDALRAHSEKRIELFRETMRQKREKRIKAVYHKQKETLLPLSKKELFIAGLFLYLGEGGKTSPLVVLSNNDPEVIKFFLYWLTSLCEVPTEKIKIRLHLYGDMDLKKELSYWADVLNLKKSQFKNPYVKQSKQAGLTYHSFGHGTCNIMVGDVTLFEKIMAGIKVVKDGIV